jgi:hypoxanthine phosphoribosyltransferase
MEADIKVLYTAEQIAERVSELGRLITTDYVGKDLVCIGTVEDSFVFLADLIRAIQRPVDCLFIKAQTSEGAESKSDYKHIFYTALPQLKNRDVLLAVGALDTGITTEFLSRNILLQEPSSLRIVALIDKPEMRRSPAVAEYAAFTVQDKYVVGYGLGTDARYKNLPSLAVLQGHLARTPDMVLALRDQ